MPRQAPPMWSRVERQGPDDCWLWTGPVSNNGFPICHRDGKLRRVHHLIWQEANGAAPQDRFIHHRCGNKLCCNPGHLYVSRVAHGPLYVTLEEALWSRVDIRGPNECWLWTAGVGSHGYGEFAFRSKVLTAHTTAYRLGVGSLGIGHVLHKCDVRRCCNPKHLYLGTQTDNNRDTIKRSIVRDRASGRYKTRSK